MWKITYLKSSTATEIFVLNSILYFGHEEAKMEVTKWMFGAGLTLHSHDVL
jgi:hypothetical protein